MILRFVPDASLKNRESSEREVRWADNIDAQRTDLRWMALRDFETWLEAVVGGVALLDTAVIETPGTDATAESSFSKYAVRSGQVL